MGYFKVAAKCGHVGKGHYIIKDFFVKAANGKAAAHKVRYLPRVKHDWKKAIVSVSKITEEEFTTGREQQRSDPYFKATSSTEQRLLGAIDRDEILDFETPERKKKVKDSVYYNKKARIQRRILKEHLAGDNFND